MDRMGNDAPDEAAAGLNFLLLMLVVIFLGFVDGGTRMFLPFTVFFIALSGAVVVHVEGDCTAPDPLVWSAGALPKKT